ncbi:hypothetical protein SPFM12_00029 [Salmonella phage SPFM12]|nr:hypothetical protein SPFM12_00029 [Salmonella phage SPFM12]
MSAIETARRDATKMINYVLDWICGGVVISVPSKVDIHRGMIANRQPDEVATDWIVIKVSATEVFGEYELSKLMLSTASFIDSFFTTDTTDITEFPELFWRGQDGQVATPEFVKKVTRNRQSLKQAFNVAIDATDYIAAWGHRSAIQRAKLDSSWDEGDTNVSTRVASLLEKQKEDDYLEKGGSVEALLGAIYQLNIVFGYDNVEKKVYICQEVISYIGWVYAYTQNIVTRIKTGWKDSGLNSGQWKAQMLPLH